MLSIDPEKIVPEKFAPFQKKLRIQAFGAVYFLQFWSGIFEIAENPAFFYFLFSNQLPDHISDMYIGEIHLINIKFRLIMFSL